MNYDSILRQCDFLSVSEAPVLANECELRVVLGQYSSLPFAIAEMLGTASSSTMEWTAVSEELALNRSEELGSETGGIPHVEILVSGVRRELGLDLTAVEYTEETILFISCLHGFLKTSSAAEVAGAVFALEASAIPELKVLGKIIEKAKGDIVQSSEPEDEQNEWLSMPLAEFIKIHTNGFEVAHRKRLWVALQPYLSSTETKAKFDAGFRYVIDAMATWWESMFQASRSTR